jgi:hypothetical protein
LLLSAGFSHIGLCTSEMQSSWIYNVTVFADFTCQQSLLSAATCWTV